MRVTTIAIGLLFAAALVPASSAGHCGGTITEIGVLYLDDRGDNGGLWIYVESNGMPGLQQGGANGLWSDECEHENPDTLIF